MFAHAWEEIVKQIEREADSAKIAELAKQLNDAMVSEEKERVKLRLGILPDKFCKLTLNRGALWRFQMTQGC